MRFWIFIITLIVAQFITACASSKPKTVDEVYEKYGTKAVYERPYTDEEIRQQEQVRHQQEKENLQKALELEQAKNKALEKKEEEHPVSRQPAVAWPPVHEVPRMIKEEQEKQTVKPETGPASEDLNFNNPLGE